MGSGLVVMITGEWREGRVLSHKSVKFSKATEKLNYHIFKSEERLAIESRREREEGENLVTIGQANQPPSIIGG